MVPDRSADFEDQGKTAGYDEVDSILISVSSSIDWLHRLANVVRRASTSRQNVKASTFVLKDELGGDVTPVLKQMFHRWVKRDFPKITDELCERLDLTMLLRRQRILYRFSRQTKQALRTAELIRMPIDSTAPLSSAGIDLKSRELSEAPLSSGPARSGVASTQQTATTVDPQRYLQVKSAPSKVSGAKTIAMTRSDKDMIPPPPRLTDSAHEFICPFCSLILPAKVALDDDGRNLWAAHVKKDLEPYVCHFFPCARGEDVFPTSTDWISHMQQAHCMRWHCTTKTHGPQTFESMEDYVAHVTAEHSRKFEPSQLPFLAVNSQHPLTRIFRSCPLCGEDDVWKGETLEDHVAHHLQYLALLSLPPPEDLYEAQVATKTSNTDSSHLLEDDKAALSRTTTRSERHLMPPAPFPEWDEYTSGTSQPADEEIPDVDEQKQPENLERWQHICATKLGLGSIDQLITEEEQRGDKTLAAFVLLYDRQNIPPSYMGGLYDTIFTPTWFCCACKGRGLEWMHSNPNSSTSNKCEDSSCGHTRCGTCTTKL